MIVPPKPCFLDNCVFYKVSGGRKIWRNPEGDRYYTWDSLHGEIEVFNFKGRHLGALYPDGTFKKNAVKGRKIDV